MTYSAAVSRERDCLRTASPSRTEAKKAGAGTAAQHGRYGSSMPFAVACTADLVRCKIMDVTNGAGSDELVLLYGLALVRFVNLITERKQKTVSIPLRRLANEMNIPEWIVNLRHDFTHGKLPNLSWCRKGCDFVMEWLRREYWSCQLGNNLLSQWESDEDNETDEDESDEDFQKLSLEEEKHLKLVGKVKHVLLSYVKHQFKVLEEVQLVSKAKKLWNCPSSEVEWIIAQVKDLIKENCEVVAELLLDEGFLIPTLDQLKYFKIECEDNHELLNMKIPHTICRFWQLLLKGLHSQAFTQMLLEKLFSELRLCCNESTLGIRPQFLVCWISEMLEANQRAGRKGKCLSPIQHDLSNKWKIFLHKVPLQWKTLLDKCLEAPCQATPHLLQRILADMKPRLPWDTQEKLMYLCSIYAQGGECFSSSEALTEYREQPIYTVESLQWKTRHNPSTKNQRAKSENVDLQDSQEDEAMDEQTNSEEYVQIVTAEDIAEKRAALQGSAWNIDTGDVKWNEFPLGRVPGQSDDPDCLMLENYSVMSILDQTMTGERNNPPGMTTSAPEFRASEGLYWTQGDLHRIKTGIQLF
ncbi:ribosomal biogenesis protein LAS1L isoform X2 [Ambystoma mexicanum]|uniref:ribosomal biogenesis protein LAS1L isoform X2 n=1 Tax=Ambystoma mexicanum TaxID=8296 RepID=UPI0037E94E61